MLNLNFLTLNILTKTHILSTHQPIMAEFDSDPIDPRDVLGQLEKKLAKLEKFREELYKRIDNDEYTESMAKQLDEVEQLIKDTAEAIEKAEAAVKNMKCTCCGKIVSVPKFDPVDGRDEDSVLPNTVSGYKQWDGRVMCENCDECDKCGGHHDTLWCPL